MAIYQWVIQNLYKNSKDTRKTDELIKIRIHFVSESIFARKFEFDMGGIDGAVGGCILTDSESNGCR